MTTVYDFSATRIEGNEQSLADFRDQVLLVVNTASQSSQTPQYSGLQLDDLSRHVPHVRQDRCERVEDASAVQLAQARAGWPARRPDQVELHQVPARAGRQCACQVRAEPRTGEIGRQDRGGARESGAVARSERLTE